MGLGDLTLLRLNPRFKILLTAASYVTLATYRSELVALCSPYYHGMLLDLQWSLALRMARVASRRSGGFISLPSSFSSRAASIVAVYTDFILLNLAFTGSCTHCHSFYAP